MELLKTEINELPLIARGKVRDIYDLDDKLLIVTSDRISAFDCVMQNEIPRKGRILNQMSVFWFRYVSDIVENHFISDKVEDYPEALHKYAEMLEERSMLVKKAKRIDVECIVRGYLSGSGWKEYGKTGAVCGIKLPEGLRESDKLPETLFTPSTKADSGHDENVSFETVVEMIGADLAEKLRDTSIRIYEKAREYADTKGIIIADTKFEFGLLGDKLILIDEILSPDSSRFWPKNDYEPGRSQKSYDKQFVRDYLESIEWNKQPPAPELPPEIVGKTMDKYKEAYQRLCA